MSRCQADSFGGVFLNNTLTVHDVCGGVRDGTKRLSLAVETNERSWRTKFKEISRGIPAFHASISVCAKSMENFYKRFSNKFFRDTKITSTFVKASLLIPRVRSLYWFVAFNPFSVNERAKTRSPPCNNNIDDFH